MLMEPSVTVNSGAPEPGISPLCCRCSDEIPNRWVAINHICRSFGFGEINASGASAAGASLVLQQYHWSCSSSTSPAVASLETVLDTATGVMSPTKTSVVSATKTSALSAAKTSALPAGKTSALKKYASPHISMLKFTT